MYMCRVRLAETFVEWLIFTFVESIDLHAECVMSHNKCIMVSKAG